MNRTQHVSPPSGTGNTPGLGEAFRISLGTGQGTYVYQIPLPDGVAGHTPRLALEYAHGTGHTEFGIGFRISLRRISQHLDFGTPEEGLAPRFLDGETEIAEGQDGTYYPFRETLFNRYLRNGAGWRIEERNGMVHELGVSAGARVAPPDQPDRPVQWLLERSLDPSGNAILYSYRAEQGIAYLASIHYASYEVRFTYEGRPDVRHDGRAGFSRRRAQRCSRIELLLDPGQNERALRTYELVYENAAVGHVSRLAEIRLRSNGASPDGSDDVMRPPVRFGYTDFDPSKYRIRRMKAEGGSPPPITDPDCALVTLDDAPLPGVLLNGGGGYYYWANLGNDRWAAPRPLGSAPLSTSFQADGLAFVDTDGSGTADLMVASGNSLQGFYENGGREGFGRFVAYPRGRHAVPPWGSPGLRLLDVDGDGLIDAQQSHRRAFAWWRNEGRQGWSNPYLVPKKIDLQDVDFSDPDVHLADMTGDGSSAIVRIRSGSIEYWPSLGRGRYGEKIVMGNSPRLKPGGTKGTLLFLDVNGDGCADLVQVSAKGLTIYLNENGIRFSDPITIPSIPPPLPGTVRSINFNGRITGLLWNSLSRSGTEYVHFEFAAHEPPHLLAEIDNGAGLVSQIHYRFAIEDFHRDQEAGLRWTTNFPFPYVVVARTEEKDLVSGRETVVDYLYHEAHFEPTTRQFQGFRSTQRIERGDHSRPDTKQVHHYLMAEERKPGNGPEHAALNGLLERIETFQLDGSEFAHLPLRVEGSTYAVELMGTQADGRKRSFVYVTSYRQEETDRTDDVRTEEKSYFYDSFGNVIREEHRAFGRKSGITQAPRERILEVTYATPPPPIYLVDKPSRIVFRGQGGELLAEKRFYYDGPDFVGLPSGQVERGLVSREEEWVLTEAEFQDHYEEMSQNDMGFTSSDNADNHRSVFASPKRNAYDVRGLLLATRDALNGETSFVYDPDGLFQVRRTDGLGVTEYEVDRTIGQITSVQSADGTIVRFAYDAQGRVLRAALPGESLADASAVYTYDEAQIPNKRIASFRQLGDLTSIGITYFDGSGQEFQQRVQTDANTFVVSGLKIPNAWGETSDEFEPTFSDDREFAMPPISEVPSRRFFYDSLGRIEKTINYNGGISTAEFHPFHVVLRDANDNDSTPANQARGHFDTPRVEHFDVFRHLVRVTEHLGGSNTVETSYEIGPQGELLSVHDGRGEKFRYSYDNRGSRLSIALRESGQRKIWYDAKKQTVRTLDPAGHDIYAEWDSLGRLLRLTSGGRNLENYRYDDLGQQAFGRLAEVTYLGGRQAFSYDEAGRILQRDYYFDGTSSPYRLRYVYDPLGREIAIIHDDGTRIEKKLTFNGWVRAIPNIIDDIKLDPRGLPVDFTFQNGIRTTFAYTPGPGRIREQRSLSPSGDLLQDVQFTFDKMEVLVNRNDREPGGAGHKEYSYDPLYQLTGVAAIHGGTIEEHFYNYAPDYNLRRFDEASATLHYDDPIHLDRLSGLTPDGSSRFNIDYDGNGNLVNLPGQAFAYNDKNELQRFVRSDGLVADYRYDHLGFRVSKTIITPSSQISETFYLGRHCEIRDGIPTYFVQVGLFRVAAITGATTLFLHEDGLGSTDFVTDSLGQLVGSMETTPFGNTTSSTGAIDHRTFSFCPIDMESGLIYMHRRYYSPGLGRFLTPDLMAIYQPEEFLHNPQGLHLYAFVANDPLNKTDPTGLSFWTVIGAAHGAAWGAVAGLAFLSGFWLVGSLMLAVAGVAYIGASNTNPNSVSGELLKGFMIGFNAGMNTMFLGAHAGHTVGTALGLVNFLAAFDGVARNSSYQSLLGWSNYLMPMSWAASGIGLLFFSVSIVAQTFWPLPALGRTSIRNIHIDWKTGTIVMHGGVVHMAPMGYNMGIFVFMPPNTSTNDPLLQHEIGHGLSVAAFGSLFLLYDFIGEMIMGLKELDYGEQIAESNANRGINPTIPMWG